MERLSGTGEGIHVREPLPVKDREIQAALKVTAIVGDGSPHFAGPMDEVHASAADRADLTAVAVLVDKHVACLAAVGRRLVDE